MFLVETSKGYFYTFGGFKKEVARFTSNKGMAVKFSDLKDAEHVAKKVKGKLVKV
jgi:hypothetical protein